MAILTRNSRRWTKVVTDKHKLDVDRVRTRDDGAIKPSPVPVLDLCANLGCVPRDSWMIGDHLIDIQSGKAAGCTTVLVTTGKVAPDFALQADFVVNDLGEVARLILG